MNRDGVSAARRSMRERAGWMRWPSASKSWVEPSPKITISPSST